MDKIAVIGAGTMGSGIAQISAQAGFEVIIRDLKEDYLEKGLTKIKKNLDKATKKGLIDSEEKENVLDNINLTTNIEELADVDLVIEAIVENLEIKQDVFQKLDQICKEETILATNTSALSITQLATATTRPEKVLGIHFFNPVPVMKLVELIKGMTTSQESFDRAEEFIAQVDKEVVKVEEAPGFIVNRILIPMVNEAAFLLTEGVASAEDIDQAMKLGANHPLGPLALGDLIGLDVCLAIMETLYDEFKDSKYRPAPLLRKKVRAKQLGRKTGQGFYNYK
ncbi:3-hydroxyacyl-CoA dehydrogenase family protein [Natroniella sp. ANB-PHB2]|uniref:3-hydroxyacyl-CoA dehydrogenase family protein n=1 Tax=Natroniella sp. ANB-PHB2 TaxID=3384444 RepID=UPI0038D3AA7F